LTIYIKEAHTEDEWQMGKNESDGVCYRQPQTLGQRVDIANDFVSRCAYKIPLLVDDMENSAELAYAAWPERLYIVGGDGYIAYKGGVGPFGFKPNQVKAWLESNLQQND
jgi:hypothetical protein